MDDQVKNLKKYPLLIFFMLFIFVLFFVDILTESKAFSEMENRYLKQRPKMTFTSLVENEYTKEYETFTNDQFAFRDQWVAVKSVSEKLLGKIENGGITYGKDGFLFPRLYDPAVVETRNNGTGFGGDGSEAAGLVAVNERQIDNNIRFLNEFILNYGGPFTVAIVPNAYQILADKLPAGMENADQAEYIDYIYESLEKNNLTTLDMMAPMADSSRERLSYYRTDHHWTTDGAYAAYAAFAEEKGLEYVSLEELAPLRREEEHFLGTHYSKTKNIGVLPDTLVWYDIPVSSVTINGEQTVEVTAGNPVPIEGLYNAEMFGRRDKYAAFLYGNYGLTVIQSGNNRNHRPGETSRIMLIKDSFGNCMAPFFTYSYDEVYVVDLRALSDSLGRLVTDTHFDDVLFIYNFDSFQKDKDVARLNF